MNEQRPGAPTTQPQDQSGQGVSTADLANPTQSQEQSTAPSQSGASAVTQVENRQVDAGDGPTALFEQDEASSFRSRWTDIQAAFQAFLK